MKRRNFNKLAISAMALGSLNLSQKVASSPNTSTLACFANGATGGTNLSGMEWTKPGLRYGLSTAPNLNFTVPRSSDVKYLANTGMTRNRLPIQWELLQPMLHDTLANASVRSSVGEPGAFHREYESYITGVLDAHAQEGIKCIIDCHNYCRYQDFKYQPDGSVIGLVVPSSALLRPYTSDNTQVQVRIFSLAIGVTLKQSNFTDFWQKVAIRWKDHPGFGGYGLMNEPNTMPTYGAVLSVNEGGPGGQEDYSISNIYSQAAIDAIRAIDSFNPIYAGGNEWSNAMGISSQNPGFPLRGNNIVYEVHMYLDASSGGFAFDYDTEVAKGYSAGLSGSINQSTGYNRIKLAIDWAKSKNVKLALTEVGMPIDDPRWQSMFELAVNYAASEGVEIYTWMGGNHWPIHSYAINHVPGWHQNKTLEPLVSGPLKASLRKAQATMFDDAQCFYQGSPLSITVYSRGNLATPVTINLSSNNSGTFSKSSLVIPAGANTKDTFTFTPASNAVTTITYSGARQVPPPRKVFSLSNPVLYSATSLSDAALAIMAKYSISKWDMNDSYTDYMFGAPSQDGQLIRAISDSGYGSNKDNALEMLNWINKANGGMGTMSIPTLKTINGKKSSDHTPYDTWGLWCKKSIKNPGVQENPKNKVLYNIEDSHFVIASVAAQNGNGIIFQASQSEELFTSELAMINNAPSAKWIDSNGQSISLISNTSVDANSPCVVTLKSNPGNQTLRVNSLVKASRNAYFSASQFNQMLIGWGFISYYPRDGFGGNIFGVLAGKGNPSNEEMIILEKYIGTLGGINF